MAPVCHALRFKRVINPEQRAGLNVEIEYATNNFGFARFNDQLFINPLIAEGGGAAAI